MNPSLQLMAPFSGPLLSLPQVPDPVFAKLKTIGGKRPDQE